MQKWRKENPDKARNGYKWNAERRKEQWSSLRLEVLNAYGNRCACCGESTPEFLCIDHIHNDGAHHRKQIGSHLYQWLKKHNFPKDRFQLLCQNCNFAKGIFGGCPHKRQEKLLAA
jgi:hypothetical protein